MADSTNQFTATTNDRPTYTRHPLKGNPLEWVEKIAADFWEQCEYDEMITPFLKLKTDRLFTEPPVGTGWFKCVNDQWQSTPADRLPIAMIIDVSSRLIDAQNDQWEATACAGLAPDGWYCWQGAGLIPTGDVELLIGHNASESDSQYFDRSYSPVSSDKLNWLDTRALAEMLRGVTDSMRPTFEKFKGVLNAKGSPEWVSKATDANLTSALETFTGQRMCKFGGGDLLAIGASTTPQTLFHDMFQDVWATLELFKVAYPMARGAAQSPAFWWGQLALTGLRASVEGWDCGLGYLQDLYDECKSIKPADRDTWQSNVVKWGSHHLTEFKRGRPIGDVLPLRVQPTNAINQHRSAWTPWVTVASDAPGKEVPLGEEWECDTARAAVPLVGYCKDTGVGQDDSDRANVIHQAEFYLPVITPPSEAFAKMRAGGATVNTRILKTRCPIPLSGLAPKCEWQKVCDQGDVLPLFVTIMQAFILEYDLDAWLAVPGSAHAMYYCRGDAGLKQLDRCGAEAVRIICEILKAVK
jgi:hypothetical protein